MFSNLVILNASMTINHLKLSYVAYLAHLNIEYVDCSKLGIAQLSMTNYLTKWILRYLLKSLNSA